MLVMRCPARYPEPTASRTLTERAHHVPLYYVQLDPALWDARDAFVGHLLYHMYHGKLPENLDNTQVLQLMALADRFQVGDMHCQHAYLHAAMNLLGCDVSKKKNSLPPVNWRWVEEGDGYVGRG